jgi:hypothetical protein
MEKEPATRDRARVEEEGFLGVDLLVAAERRAPERPIVVVNEMTTRQRRAMRVIAEHEVHGGPGKDRLRLGGRRVGIDGDARAADPFDGEKRLDRGATIGVPEADPAAAHAFLDQRAGKAPDTLQQGIAAPRGALGVVQQNAIAGALQRLLRLRAGADHADALSAARRCRNTSRRTLAPPSTVGRLSTMTMRSGTSCRASPAPASVMISRSSCISSETPGFNVTAATML